MFGKKFKATWDEIMRVRWMLVISVFVVLARAYQWLPETSPTLLVLYKPSLAAIGFIAAHIGYQQAFPYLSMGDLLFRACPPKRYGEKQGVKSDVTESEVNKISPETQMVAAICFLGACIIRGAIYLAFILGVTMGL